MKRIGVCARTFEVGAVTRVSLVAAFAVGVAGCSGADPSTLSLGHGTWGGVPGSGGAFDDGGSSGSTGGGDAGGGDAASTGNDAGASGHDAAATLPDAAPPDAAPPPNAFTGAGPYASAPPGNSAQAQHGFSLAGHNCADCHGGSNPSSGRRFDFAGRVFADPNGQTPASDVEVRVVDHNGAATSVHSDANGYFWHNAATDLAMPALAGARSGATTKLMIGALADPVKRGGCNGCHDGTTTSFLHVP